MANSQMNVRKANPESFFEKFYQEGGWRAYGFQRDAYWERVKIYAHLVNSVGTGLKVLDLGCGKAEMSRFLSSQNEVYGMDVSLNALKDASYFLNNLVLADASSIPFEDNFFDIVTYMEAIYYLDNPIKSLEEIKRVLKPDGFLFLSCSLANSPHLWLRLLLHRIRNSSLRISTSNGSVWETKRYFSFTVIKMLNRAGFIVIKEVPFLLFIPLLQNKRWLKFLIKLGELYPMIAYNKLFIARPK